MTIHDRIYGQTTLDSKVILELINCRAVQRLKGICQYGIPDEFYHFKNFSRYDHSVGVMLLLKKLGASEEEQIAGLLHDVSHTAFSHVIDWVLGEGGAENYQDDHHEQYIASTEIPRILQKYDYSAARIADYRLFGLLERDLPDLCADRFDYSLKEFPNIAAQTCLAALTARDGQIVFANKKAAVLFAEHFLARQTIHWGGAEGVTRYKMFAKALRLALKDGIIQETDFWQNDDFVLGKLITSQNKEVQALLQALRAETVRHLQAGTTIVYKKFRHVDPLFIDGNQLRRLSQASPDFAGQLAKARQENQRGIVIPQIAET